MQVLEEKQRGKPKESNITETVKQALRNELTANCITSSNESTKTGWKGYT